MSFFIFDMLKYGSPCECKIHHIKIIAVNFLFYFLLENKFSVIYPSKYYFLILFQF